MIIEGTELVTLKSAFKACIQMKMLLIVNIIFCKYLTG